MGRTEREEGLRGTQKRRLYTRATRHKSLIDQRKHALRTGGRTDHVIKKFGSRRNNRIVIQAIKP